MNDISDSQNNVASLIAEISWPVMATRLGVTRTAILNAKAKGVFPPHWYPLVKEVCTEKGIDCPMRLFSFKQPPEPDAHPAPSDADSEGA